MGHSLSPQNIKKCRKLNLNFQKGWRGLRKDPSAEEVWILSGTVHYQRMHCTESDLAIITVLNLTMKNTSGTAISTNQEVTIVGKF